MTNYHTYSKVCKFRKRASFAVSVGVVFFVLGFCVNTIKSAEGVNLKTLNSDTKEIRENIVDIDSYKLDVIAAFKSENVTLRRLAEYELLNLPEDQVQAYLPELVKLLSDERHAIRAARAFKKLGTKAVLAVPSLVTIIEKNKLPTPIVDTLYEGLASIGATKETIPFFEKRLVDYGLSIRAIHTLVALSKIKDYQFDIGFLTAILRRTKSELWYYQIAQVLGHNSNLNENEKADLLRLTDSSDGVNQQRLIYLLNKLGFLSKDVAKSHYNRASKILMDAACMTRVGNMAIQIRTLPAGKEKYNSEIWLVRNSGEIQLIN